MKTKWIVLCIAIILIGFFITIAGKQLTTPHELSSNEMTAQIEQVYGAKVQTIVEQNDSFIASFNKNGSIFEVNVNAVTGQFSNLTLVHKKRKQKIEPTEETPKTEQPITEPKKEQPTTTAPNTETVETPQPKPAKPAATKPLLSQQQAITIALKEVPGEIDSVEFEISADGGSYFIEIEQEDEVTVQVHAITGKILSIQYDD